MNCKYPIEIPSVPNFILTEKRDVKIPLNEFDDEELNLIAKEWTRRLIKRADQMRINPTPY